MLFKGVKEEEVDTWAEASNRVEEGVGMWVDVVGVRDAVRRMGDPSIFRVLEWGGMEVFH